MSKFKGALNHNNVLNIVNGNSLRDYLENYAKYIVNANKDTILPLINSGQRAWAFILGAFIIEGLI
jgi:uncharacterized protein YfdQ (DUF2303 family)